MSYHSVTLALMVGVAIGTAIYYYFKNENNPQYQYTYDSEPDPNYTFRDHTPNRRKRRKDTCDKCSICLEVLEKKANVQTSCGHFFHKHCIQMWLRQQSTCPICRETIQQPS